MFVCSTLHTRSVFVYLIINWRLIFVSALCAPQIQSMLARTHTRLTCNSTSLAEIFCDFPQSVQAASSTVLQIRPQPLPSRFFSTNYSFDTTHPELQTASLTYCIITCTQINTLYSFQVRGPTNTTFKYYIAMFVYLLRYYMFRPKCPTSRFLCMDL
jgi:hypothetical protein